MDDEKVTNGNWDSCKMYVLQELKRMNSMHDKMDNKLDGLSDKLTLMQVKVAAIGGVAGLVVTLITLLVSKALAK